MYATKDLRNYLKEGTMRKLITLLAVLTLAVPLMFLGCSGDDGSTGAAGPPGAPGDPGPPGTGVVANETCTLCHSAGANYAVDKMHGLDPASRDTLKAGTAEVEITDVALPAPTDNYVKAQVDFTFQAFDSAGINITDKIDLTTTNTAGNLSYATFSIAKLEPGIANQWSSFVLDPGAGGSGPYRTIAGNGINGAIFTRTPGSGIDTYSYTFADNALRVDDGYVDNVVYRVTVQASNFNVALFTSDPALQANDRRAVANAFRDQVGDIGGAAVTFPVPPGYPTRNVVTTAACNQCHDPLGMHSQGARRETTYCVVCHNPKTESVGNPSGGGWDNVSMVNMVHKIHINPDLAEDLGWTKTPGRGAIVFGIDISDITYPQDIRNCTTCHQGGSDSDNWKSNPTRYACGACHVAAMSTAPHLSRPDSGCTSCHAAEGGTKDDSPPSVEVAHSTDTATPGNVPPGLDNIAYFIDNVTVDNTSSPVVTFRVEKNGTPIVFNTYSGADNAILKRAFVDNGLIDGYNRSPELMVAFAADQDGINAVADYNNLGNGKIQGQPARVAVAEIFLNDNNAGTIVSGPDGSGNYTVKLLNAVSRASAANGGAITATTSAKYPAGASKRAVALLGSIRQRVDGGEARRYAESVMRPVVAADVRRQVVDSNSCQDCHKQLALHGGSRVKNVQVCVMCHNPNLGEGGAKSVNFKDLVHAIHSGTTAYPPWSETRGTTGMGWANITYPGELSHCTKCHIDTTYKADLPAGVLFSTNSEMGLAPALTDNVVSPTAAACGRCHNDPLSLSHIVLQGGGIGVTREEATTVPPVILAPEGR
jgi:OmcA/MtrC family decaheme c-type cytochrome